MSKEPKPLPDWIRIIILILLAIFALSVIVSLIVGLFILHTQGWGTLWQIASTNPWLGIPWVIGVIILFFVIVVAGS